MACRSATAPLAALPELWNTMFPIFTDPGSSITVWGVMVPVWSAATLVMTLKVGAVVQRRAVGGRLQLLERGLLDRLGEDVRIERRDRAQRQDLAAARVHGHEGARQAAADGLDR